MVKKLSEKHLRQLHLRYLSGELAQELAAEAGVCAQTLSNWWFKKMKLTSSRLNPRRGRLHYDIKHSHTQYLRKIPIKQLAQEAGVRKESLLAQFKKHGLSRMPACSRSKPAKWLELFQPELSPEGAYWLGFFLADGHYTRNVGKYRITGSVKLTQSSKERSLFGSLVARGYGTVYEHGNAAVFVGTQSSDYENCGTLRPFLVKKVDRLLFPKGLSAGLSWQIVRGFFDGDGSFYWRKGDGVQWILYSICQSFLKEVQKFLRKQGIPTRLYKTQVKPFRRRGQAPKLTKKANTMYSLRATAASPVREIVKRMFENVSSLPRHETKFERISKWLQHRAKDKMKVLPQCNA